MSLSDILASWRTRPCVLGTKHHKERVVTPLCEAALGMQIVVPTDFDTDQFGTFTRDIARAGTQYEAAKQKALAACAHTGYDLAIASEGSFGTHPQIPFLPWHTELVLLVDTVHDLEIAGYYQGSDLRVSGQTVRSASEAVAVATAWGFPLQGVILRESETSNRHIYKDIKTLEELEQTAKTLLGRWFRNDLYIETDMRAHRCPARVAGIASATKALIQRCQSLCPDCGTPGFGIVRTVAGLPCGQCGRPTCPSQWSMDAKNAPTKSCDLLVTRRLLTLATVPGAIHK